MNIAVILAGGMGSRFSEKTPKLFVKIAGKTVIEHAIDAFEQNQNIDEIAVVIHANLLEKLKSIVAENQWKKVKQLFIGGKERYFSTLAALNFYKSHSNSNLIFHDAARPLVSQRIIDDTIKYLKKYSAVCVAIPATDTIFELNSEKTSIQRVPIRNFLYRAQTPQAFKLHTIHKAYQLAMQDSNFTSTDDCGVVSKYLPQEKIFIVQGEEENIKLTDKKDFFLIEYLIKQR